MNDFIVKQLELTDYESVYTLMKSFTQHRDDNTQDEIWITQHHPVFTQGQAGKEEHILSSSHIPIVKTDRGGQVTYHGPGQVVVYFLVDIQRQKINIRQMVSLIENTIVFVLSEFNIKAISKPKAPGVYINEDKIASLGLRVRKGRTYHGVAMNINMDLSPFKQINPCGYQGLQMTQLTNHLSDKYQNLTNNELFDMASGLIVKTFDQLINQIDKELT